MFNLHLLAKAAQVAVAPLLSRAAMRAERTVAQAAPQVAHTVATGAAALVPGAHTTAQELGAALRMRAQQRGAQQLAQAMGHAPVPGASPFMPPRPAIAPPPSWVGKVANTKERMSNLSPRDAAMYGIPYEEKKPKPKKGKPTSFLFGQLIDSISNSQIPGC